jgi:large subunit ribosomal protein L10
MKKEDKNKIIDVIAGQIEQFSHFYLTDISDLNAADTSVLRRKCFERDIELLVVKNTLLRKAFDRFENKYEELFNILQGGTSVMFSNSANEPAKLIKEFRKAHPKPLLKGAYVEESVYIGDNQIDALVSIKSKEELIGDIIGLLQSPIRTVISALESGKHTIAGVVKTLSEKNN